MATLTIGLTGSNPASGARVELGQHKSAQFDEMGIFYLNFWIDKVLDDGLKTAGASGLDALRPWHVCLSMAMLADDEETFFRPAFHLDARTISRLSAAGAAFYFDVRALGIEQSDGEENGDTENLVAQNEDVKGFSRHIARARLDRVETNVAKLELDFIGLHPVTGTGVGLARYKDAGFRESDYACLKAWIHRIMGEGLEKARVADPNELRPWHAWLSMAMSADSDEKFRPAFYFDASIISRLSAVGAAFDFDPYV